MSDLMRAARPARTFIGVFRCERCYEKRVRVYDWLPVPVLCAGCATIERAAGEEQQEEDNDRDA